MNKCNGYKAKSLSLLQVLQQFQQIHHGVRRFWITLRPKEERSVLSVSYDIKYQRVARKHMATSRDKEHSRAGSSADTIDVNTLPAKQETVQYTLTL